MQNGESLEADAVILAMGYRPNSGIAERAGLPINYVAAVRATGKDVIVFAEPNAGKPELLEGEAVYRVTPEEFAEAEKRIFAAGVRVLGGCCGTAPPFIAAVARALR